MWREFFTGIRDTLDTATQAELDWFAPLWQPASSASGSPGGSSPGSSSSGTDVHTQGEGTGSGSSDGSSPGNSSSGNDVHALGEPSNNPNPPPTLPSNGPPNDVHAFGDPPNNSNPAVSVPPATSPPTSGPPPTTTSPGNYSDSVSFLDAYPTGTGYFWTVDGRPWELSQSDIDELNSIQNDSGWRTLGETIFPIFVSSYSSFVRRIENEARLFRSQQAVAHGNGLVFRDPWQHQELKLKLNREAIQQDGANLVATVDAVTTLAGPAKGLLKAGLGSGKLILAKGMINHQADDVVKLMGKFARDESGELVVPDFTDDVLEALERLKPPRQTAANPPQAQYIFDHRVHNYRDAITGRLVAAKNLPWPDSNGGFISPTNGSLLPGKRLDRYGSPSGRYLADPEATISQRGLPHGSEHRPYNQYEVVKPFEAIMGQSEGVPAFGATGGGMQYKAANDQTIQWLLDNGFIRKLP